MPIRPVLVHPHPILNAPTQEITLVDDDLRALIADMVATMHAEAGVGLAANQVGDQRRVFVLDLSGGEDPSQVRVFVNPKIHEMAGSQSGDEGCLSFPGIFEVITRPERVRFTATTLEGEPIDEVAEGFFARAVCHEIDHLDGRVFLERMSPLKRTLVLRKISKLRQRGEWPEYVLAG